MLRVSLRKNRIERIFMHMVSAGAAIAAYREAQDLSQRGLARLAKKSSGYLSQVESGKKNPTKRWLAAVTAALGKHLAGVSE